MRRPALDALNDARHAVRNDGEAEVVTTSHALALALGVAKPSRRTVRAVQAVVARLELPGSYLRDQDAWEAHGVTRSAYLKWKQRIHAVALQAAADQLGETDLLEFTAAHASKPTVGCFAMPDSACEAEMVRANREAALLLHEHARGFIFRNRGEATYEAWVAMLHPENVALDSRLKTEGCEHQRIWESALASAASQAAEPLGLVELSVLSAFSLAVLSVDVSLSLVDALLTTGAAAAREGRVGCTPTGASPCSAAVLLPPTLVAASIEAALEIGSAATLAGGTLALTAVTVLGGLTLALLAPSPAAGRHAASRLRSRGPRLRRRLRLMPERLAAAFGLACRPDGVRVVVPVAVATPVAPAVDHRQLLATVEVVKDASC